MPAKPSALTTARIEFRPTSVFAAEPLPEFKTVTPIAREQSNSSIIVDNKFVVKLLRRITAGVHPEIEIGRFLADVAHFENAPLLLGSVELVEGDQRSALAVVHRFVENQGDAWSVTGNGLNRLVEEQRLTAAETIPETPDAVSPCCSACARSGAAPPKCISPSPRAPTRPASSPSRSAPTTWPAGPTPPGARAQGVRIAAPAAQGTAGAGAATGAAPARPPRRHRPPHRVGLERDISTA